MKDLYKTLGVKKEASKQEIKDAYKKKAKKAHPDSKTGDVVKFQEINEAYTILFNESSREKYDKHGTIENERDTINEEALETIAALFNQLLDNESFDLSYDLIRMIKEALAEQYAVTSIQIKKAGQRISKLKKLDKKIKNKRSDPNIFKKMLEHKIARISKELNKKEKTKEMLNVAQKILDDYEFEKDNSSDVDDFLEYVRGL